MKNILLFILIFNLVVCKQNIEKKIGKKNDDLNKSIQSLNIEKKQILFENSVLFFTLSQQEYNSLNSNEKIEVDELLSDFYTYYERVKKILEKQNLKVVLSAKEDFSFQFSNGHSERFNRKNKENIVGIAFFGKNKNPRMEYGVFVDDDILKMAKDYFGINFE